MRIGLLGGIDGQGSYVKGLGSFCLDALRADRLVYLGGDDELDRLVNTWAVQLVGEQPQESAIWQRSLRCLDAGAESIDHFIVAERARQSLKRYQSLPDAGEPCVEVLQHTEILLCHSPANVNEAELGNVRVVAYGDATRPEVHCKDGRFWICPGSLREAGLLVLDETGGELRLRLFDRTARLCAEHTLRADGTLVRFEPHATYQPQAGLEAPPGAPAQVDSAVRVEAQGPDPFASADPRLSFEAPTNTALGEPLRARKP